MSSSGTHSKNNHSKNRQDRSFFLQQIADFTPDMLFVIDLNQLEVIYVNNRIEKLLGYEPAYVYDKGHAIFETLLHPDDYKRRMAHLETCKKLPDEVEAEIEVRLKSAEGNYIWFRIRDKVFKRDHKGAVSQIVSSAQNIQEQKLANEKLKEEHRRLKSSQDMGHIGSFERDLPGDLLICTEEFFRIHGLEPKTEGISFQKLTSFVHPDEQEDFLEAMGHLHTSERPLNEVHRIVRPDGSIRHVNYRANLILDEQGKPFRSYGTIQDITEQLEAQKKLKHNESLMRRAEEVGHFGSYEFDLRNGKLQLSDGFYRLFGYEPHGFEATAEFIDSVSHPADTKRVQKVLEKAQKDKQPYLYYRRIYRPDGEIRYLSCNGKVICDKEGNAIKFIGIVEDITERKKVDEKLQEEHRRLLEAQAIGHIGSFEWELDRDRIHWTEEMYHIHGLDPQSETITIERFFGLIHPDDAPRVRRNVLQANKRLRHNNIVYRVVHPNGELHFINGLYQPFTDEDGKVALIKGTVQDITEQKKAELELKESKEFAEQITSTTPDLIFIHDASTNNIIYANHNHFWNNEIDDLTFTQMQDYQRVEAMVHPDDMVKAITFLEERKQLANGEVKEVDLRMSGKIEWVRIRSKIFRRDESGRPTQIISFVSDITDKKKAEQELNKAYTELGRSNTTISRMLEGSLAAIVLLDPLRDEKGNIIDFIFKGVNKAAQDIKNKTEAELLGQRLLFKFPAVRHLLFDALLKVMETGKSVRLERHYRTNPEDSWMDVSATKNGDGLILTFIDITDRKKAEEQLEENALFIRKIADTTPDILFVFDKEKRQLQYINRSPSSLLGKNLESLQKMDTEELLYHTHPEDREGAIDYLRSFSDATDEEVKEIELRIRNLLGEWRWFHCRGRVFKRSKEGKALQQLFIMQDITEKKNTANALLEAEKLSIKGTMSRTIAHEVRGPAANISLSMEMIQKALGDTIKKNEDARVFFGIVIKSCDRIMEFINDLINIPTTEQDTFLESDLSVLVEEVLKEAQDRIFLKGIQVEKHYNFGFFITANPKKLKIALLNIVINAVEAMEEKKGILQIFIRQQEDKIQIIVQDNGSGMTEEQISKMFDVYYTSKPNGMGVGLANVQAILTDHNAQVDVKSTPGKGTAFSVAFPKTL